MKKYVIFTVDFESWFQIENLSSLRTNNKLFQDSRLDDQLETLLEFLAKRNIKATFFILGSVALRFKQLVEKIVKNGHEISSHGTSHRLNYELTYKELKGDIKKSKKILEDISQRKVLGYRAPCFSIEDRLLKVLNELDFKYDSSLNMSSLNSRYGKLKNHKIVDQFPIFLEDYKLLEFPLPIFKIKKFYYPISGGGFGRLTPRILWKLLIKKFFVNQNYLVLYIHPWEIDPNIPKIKTSFKKDFANYYGLSRFMKKIEYLHDSLKEFTTWTNFENTLNHKFPTN